MASPDASRITMTLSSIETLYTDPKLSSPITHPWLIPTEELESAFTKNQEAINDLHLLFAAQRDRLVEAIDQRMANATEGSALDDWPGVYDGILGQVRDLLTTKAQSAVLEMHRHQLWRELRSRLPRLAILSTGQPTATLSTNQIDLPLSKALAFAERYCSLKEPPRELSPCGKLKAAVQSIGERSKSKERSSGGGGKNVPSHLRSRQLLKKAVDKQETGIGETLCEEPLMQTEQRGRLLKLPKDMKTRAKISAQRASTELGQLLEEELVAWKALLSRSVTRQMRQLTRAQLRMDLAKRNEQFWLQPDSIYTELSRDLGMTALTMSIATKPLETAYDEWQSADCEEA